MAIMVPPEPTCYILWQLLCFLQPLWGGERLRGVTRHEIMQSMTKRPVGGRQKCQRYSVDLMDAAELKRIERGVRDLQIHVVVICMNARTEVPPDALGRCSVLCWSRMCGPAYGLLGTRSRLTYMCEEYNSRSFATCTDGGSSQAVRPYHQNVRSQTACTTREEAPPTTGVQLLQGASMTDAESAHMLTVRSAPSALSASAALQDDREYTQIVSLIAQLWLQFAPDSHAAARLKGQLGGSEAGIFLTEHDVAKGYRAMVRSPGQLVSLSQDCAPLGSKVPMKRRGKV